MPHRHRQAGRQNRLAGVRDVQKVISHEKSGSRLGTAFCCSLRCLVVAGVRGAEGNVVIAALDDAGGGDERELRVLLQVRDRRHAAVAHGRLDLVKASCDVILQGARVGDVGIHALFKRKARLAAEVVTLPVARAVRAFAPVFLDVHAVDKQLVRRRFVEASEVAAQHQEVRAPRRSPQ